MSDPIATSDDLAAVLGFTVDPNRADLLLSLAQELCETIVSPVPANARSVVLSAAVRAYTNPQNANSETSGPFATNYGAAAGGLYLTKQDRATLLRIAGRGGAFSVDPTPSDAGSGLPPWDQNVTWLNGIPVIETQNWPGT